MGRRNQGPRLRFLERRNTYYICWTERGRSRERSTGTANREEAEIALGQFIRTKSRRAGPRDPSEILVTEILTDYAEERGPNVQSGDRIGYAIDPLSNYFAGRTLAEINDTTLAGYERWRERNPSTVRRELGVLRAAVNFAARNSRITRAVPVKLPEEGPAKERWLTRTEVAMLLAGAVGFSPVCFDIRTRMPIAWRRVTKSSPHLALFILIGLYCGRRKEAILSLRWSSIDLYRRTIDFRRPGQKETKKKRGQCRIPDHLIPHLVRAKPSEHAVGPVITWRDKGTKDIQTAFGAAAERAYIDGISPHVLKHTAASWLMQAGHDPWKVADFLATSLTTLLKHYGHHHPNSQAEIAKAHGKRPQNVRRIS